MAQAELNIVGLRAVADRVDQIEGDYAFVGGAIVKLSALRFHQGRRIQSFGRRKEGDCPLSMSGS